MDEARTAGRRGNIVASALLVALGVLVFAQTAELAQIETGSDPGAAGYPRLLAGVLIVLAVGVGMQRVSGDALPSLAGLARVAGAVALLVVYALVLDVIGYVLATAGLLVGTMLLMGIRRSWSIVLVPVVFSLTIFLIFYNVFGVPLPRGVVEGLLP